MDSHHLKCLECNLGLEEAPESEKKTLKRPVDLEELAYTWTRMEE